MHTFNLIMTRLLLAAVLFVSAMAQTPSVSPSMMSEIPTASPTVAESESPTDAPDTDQPTVTPEEPSKSPTDAPTIAPSSTPTVAATQATTAPSSSPTDAPTGTPTVAPSGSPTETQETDSPTADIPLTEVPSVSPTIAPSAEDTTPSASPTETATVSSAPTAEVPEPTVSPTGVPTSMPSVASQVPSMMPSSNGTSSGPPTTTSPPVTSPPTTAPPTPPVITDSISGLRMGLVGLVEQFSTSDSELWQNATKEYFEGFYNDRRRRLLRTLQAVSVENVETTLKVTDTQVLNDPDTLEVTYDQEVSYVSDSGPNSDLTNKLVSEPFEGATNQQVYASDLRAAGRAAGNDVFDNLVTTTGVALPEESSGDSGLSTGAIIGIACGGAAGLLLLGGGAMYWRSRRNAGGAAAGSGYLKSDSEDAPPQSLSGARSDEVSTLGDPKTKSGVASGDEFTGYGDQSVATVDYDYSKAYGGAGESVSSAGGTFGSNTQGQASMAAGIGAGAALAGAAAYSDDESFDAQYRGNQREEVIDVYAPSGKLGVVIDTPDDGPPVVHAIKDSSVIADKLQVGDQLVSVDDEDVRSMTAIKVSKLISRKSGNATRKLTVIRRVAAE